MKGAYIKGNHRYCLWRKWGEGGTVVWILLNPSTADALEDDPTVRKCIAFTKLWGQQAGLPTYGSIIIVNLYSWRATKPKDLRGATTPYNDRTDKVIELCLRHADRVMCGWGANPALDKASRVSRVMGLIRAAGHTPEALRVTQAGHPEHPLYIPYAVQPQPYEAPAAKPGT